MLQRDPLGKRHLPGQPVDSGEVVGLAVGGLPGGVVISPQRYDDKGHEHRVEHGDSREDEPGDIIVLLPAMMRNPALGQVQADRDGGDDTGEDAEAGPGKQHRLNPTATGR